MDGLRWSRCSIYGRESGLSKFHELFCVWGTFFRGVVRLVEDDMAGGFDLSSGGVLKFDDAVGRSITKECAGGGVFRVDFVASNPRLFYSNVAAENTEVCEVRYPASESLKWCDSARKGGVREAVFDVDCV